MGCRVIKYEFGCTTYKCFLKSESEGDKLINFHDLFEMSVLKFAKAFTIKGTAEDI